jgi:hypothetical protein
MELLTRIVVGLLSVGFLVAWFAWKWKRAGQSLAEKEAFQRRGVENYERIQQHPAFQQLVAALQSRHRVVFDVPTDPAAYQLVWAAFVDDRAFAYKAEDAHRASMIVGYLQRRDGSQLQVAMTLRDGRIHETVPPYGWVLQAPTY